MIFSRSGRTAGRQVRHDRPGNDRPGPDEPTEGPPNADTGAGGAPGPAPSASSVRSAATTGESAGPYDISEAPPAVRRVDLGSLRVPLPPGVEVRVQANQDGAIQRVLLVHGDSALQLGAFAAPRSEGIWDEVRADIRTSLSAEGVAVEEADGPYGRELRARLSTEAGQRDLRVVGVDGPRWMVRADFHGAAAVDPDRVGPLAECLLGLVVDRGNEARPVRESLPLRLPPEMAAQLQRPQPGEQVTPQSAEAPAQQPAAPGVPAAGGGADGGGADGGTAAQRKPSPRPRRT